MIKPAFEILNQRGTPMFFSDVFANRPNAGIVGRIFISTDTFAFYRDNGVTWDLIGGPGTGTITGSGTAFKYPVFTNTQEIGDGTIEQLSTKNQSTKDFEVKTSTDDGIYESELFLTNRFSGVDDTITFQYGRTISAGTPFLKISDNNALFPTSNLQYQGGQFGVYDSLLVVQNTIQNNIADFYAVEPVVRIGATGASNNAQLTFSASAGTYAGIIRLGNSGNVFQIRTFANVVALQVNDNTSVSISNLGGSGNQMVVVDNTGLLSKQAIPTIFGSLATGQVAFGSATNTIAGSNNLFWDNANGRLGVGTNNPSYTFHTISSASTIGAFRNSGAAIGQLLVGNTAADLIIRILASGDGLISSDTSKYLAFGTNAGTERMRLDASGNLGVGVVPSAWSSTYRALQVGVGTSLYNLSTSNGTFLGSNYFFNGTNNIYINTATATAYGQVSGQHQWFNAPSGTAGNVITFTQAMTLAASGNLLVGTSTDVTGKVQVVGAGGIRINEDGSNTKVLAIRSDFASVDPAINVVTSNSLLLMTANTERARIFSDGNVSIGTTINAGYKLDVNGTMRVSGASTFGTLGAGTGMFWDNTNNRLAIGTTSPQTQFDISNVFMVGNISAFPSATYDAGVIIARTEGSGSAPFNNAGSIVYRARVSSVAGRSSHIFYTGSPSVEAFKIIETGDATFISSVTAASYTINDAGNITIGTTTGTKIGTATTQKIGLWNATPIVQPTTAVGSATFNSPGGGSAIKTDDTFDGYTIQQVVKALRDIGILA